MTGTPSIDHYRKENPMRSTIHLNAADTASAWAAVLSLRTNVLMIDQNADYVLREVPGLPSLGEQDRTRIHEVWESLSSCCYDVKKEVRNLEDKLGLHGNDEWFDSDISNDDPRVTTHFITSWLGTEIHAIDALVRMLDQSQNQPGCSLAYLLVAESAVNVLHSMQSIYDAVDQVHELVPARATPASAES
jgi:hypothetical protein